jgi:hypothetical protein
MLVTHARWLFVSMWSKGYITMKFAAISAQCCYGFEHISSAKLVSATHWLFWLDEVDVPRYEEIWCADDKIRCVRREIYLIFKVLWSCDHKITRDHGNIQPTQIRK